MRGIYLLILLVPSISLSPLLLIDFLSAELRKEKYFNSLTEVSWVPKINWVWSIGQRSLQSPLAMGQESILYITIRLNGQVWTFLSQSRFHKADRQSIDPENQLMFFWYWQKLSRDKAQSAFGSFGCVGKWLWWMNAVYVWRRSSVGTHTSFLYGIWSDEVITHYGHLLAWHTYVIIFHYFQEFLCWRVSEWNSMLSWGMGAGIRRKEKLILEDLQSCVCIQYLLSLC